MFRYVALISLNSKKKDIIFRQNCLNVFLFKNPIFELSILHALSIISTEYNDIFKSVVMKS